VTTLAAQAGPATLGIGEADEASGRFRAVFEAEFAYVWTSLRRLGVQARDLEDVTHDVMLEVYRNFHRYDASRPLRPWLFAFAFRFASDYRRLSRHKVEVMDETAEGISLGAPADEAVARREGRALIARALEAVELDRRAVFILHEIDERPMAEIAESMGIPLHTAYSRLRVAREEFESSVRRIQRGLR
jgi:RNA polymerase sigma-70 factor (ECF subfamily)